MGRRALGFSLLLMTLVVACVAARSATWARPVLAGGAIYAADAPGDDVVSLSGTTDVTTCLFAVHHGVRRVTLRLESELGSGALAWVLLDPHGKVRWTNQITGPDALDVSRAFTAVAGEWKLKIALAKAYGHYAARWDSD
ncbi:MAG: hypothetical protein JXA74_02840 [Anaerolineae bacterium]|nr:hypothetical protein [Anaerolineae bacterium]